MQEKHKLWTKDYIVSIFLMFFIFISYYLTATSITEYSLEVFEVNQSRAWLASSLFTAGCLAARVLSGRYMEIWGRKRTMFASLLVFLATMVSCLADLHWIVFLVLRSLQGLAFGICTTVLPAVVMDLVPDTRKGEGNSYFTLSTTIATALGPFLGIFLTNRFAVQNIMFIVCTGFAVIAILIALLLKVPEVQMTQDQRSSMKGFRLSNYLEKSAVPISSVTLIMGIGYASIMSYIYSYAEEIGMQNAASTFFLFYAIFIVLCRPAAGKLMDRHGENIIMYPCILIYAVAFAILAFSSQSWMILLSGSLVGIGYGSLISTAQTVCVKYAPKHRIALATSAHFTGMDIGVFLGPLIIGNILKLVGFRGVYLLMSALVFISFFLYHLIHGRLHKQTTFL